MRLLLIRVLALTILAPPSSYAGSPPPVEVHYSPVENLEHIDLALLNGAETSIDFAGFVLADWPVIDALKSAIARGVKVRVLLDPTQRSAYDRLTEFKDLVRVKARRPIMHLKAFAVDGKVLRTGSANFSGGGLKQQDNDLVIIRDEAIATAFTARFEVIYGKAEPMRVEADVVK